MQEHKIVVLGTMGAGKSTLVRAIAGSTVIDTDVRNTDGNSGKMETTVAMDYADVDLPNGDRLRLYGTPGQSRFSFIWPILLQGASGVVVLADASRESMVEDIDCYLDSLREHARDVPAVVGISKLDIAPAADMDACSARVCERFRPLPVVPFDARSESEVMVLMDVLMGEIETAALVGTHA